MKKSATDKIVVATNHNAHRFFKILDRWEAGLALKGAEVKSLRGGKSSLDGCYAKERDGELYLVNYYIAPYRFATFDVPDPRRDRKLLFKRGELDRLLGRLRTEGVTLVPLEIYFRGGWAKAELGLAKGKRGPDRRDDLKRKDLAREAEKSFKGKYRG